MLGTSTVERWEVCISAFSRQILSIGVDEFLNGLLEFFVKWKTHEWSQSLGALLFILNQ